MATIGSGLSLPAGLSISDIALSSWIKSTRRFFKTLRCPICRHPGRIRRGHLICDSCNRGWPLDDIQDIISEIDAARLTSSGPASSRLQPGPTNPHSSDPGCSTFKSDIERN
jgi:hypothetical protein